MLTALKFVGFGLICFACPLLAACWAIGCFDDEDDDDLDDVDDDVDD